MVTSILVWFGIFVGLVLFTSMLFRVVVPTNEVHIVQTRKSTDPYGKWFEKGAAYFKRPSWLPIIGIERIILPVSIFTIELDDYKAYDIGKVPFVVDVKARFRVEEPKTAGQRISNFAELKSQLDDILRWAIRKILASSDVEEIMVGRGKFGGEFAHEVELQAKAFWVTTENIELMDIRDPESKESTVINDIMEKKKSMIEKQSRIEVANNQRDAEIAEIQAKKEAEIEDQDAQRIVGEKTAEKEKFIGIADEKAKQDIAIEAKITKEKDMEVIRVNDVKQAEINKDVEIVKADEIKQTAIIQAEWQREQIVIDAEGIKKDAIIQAEWQQSKIEKIAEGNKNAEVMRAKGIEAVGVAQASAKKAMELAPVMAQIELAKEIWSNENYMEYLLGIDWIKAWQVVGVAKADALKSGDLKIIANGQWDGTVDGWFNNILDIFTGKWWANIATMLETLKNTPAGKELFEKFMAKKERKVPTPPPAPKKKVVDGEVVKKGKKNSK